MVGRNVVMGLFVGPGNPPVRDSCLIYLAYWVILLVLVVPCWMVLLSCVITLSLLLVRSLLGGFLWGGNVPGIIESFGVSEHASGAHGGLGSDGRSFVRQSFQKGPTY